jgi:hypothetical protein
VVSPRIDRIDEVRPVGLAPLFARWLWQRVDLRTAGLLYLDVCVLSFVLRGQVSCTCIVQFASRCSAFVDVARSPQGV